MGTHSQGVSLRQLLDQCSDPADPYFQSGWGEFYRRFHALIHYQVKINCHKWNAKRLDLQIAETVRDIEAEVYVILSRNNCHNLKNYSFRDDERRFHAWLKRICETTTSYFLKKYFRQLFEKTDVQDFIFYLSGVEDEVSWEYYEMITEVCRQSSSRKNLERDLNIFFMNVFADLSEPMIRSHPCFADLGGRVVELAVFRVREALRKNPDLRAPD
ncbi:hypothetical protein MJD09_06250 [bacterium]|nr:hypothetical protein [bacterium]